MRGSEWECRWRFGRSALDDAALWSRWEQTRGKAVEAHVFHRPAVLRAWYDTVGEACGSEPAIGELVAPSGIRVWLAAAITPYRGRLVHRAICEPAGQELFGYHDPLADAPLGAREWDGFWKAVRASLRERCDVGLFRFVHDACAGRALREPAGDASPVLALRDMTSLDDVLARCSPNHRGDVRRRLRRMSEQGAVDLRVFGAADAGAALADFTTGLLPAWQARHAPAAARPGFAAFGERIVTDGLRQHYGHYSVLSLDGTPVAWHLGLCDAGRLYWWMPVHDAAWEPYSPGKVLLALLIDRLVRDGWRELHFQTGRQPYKLAWRPDEPPLSAIRWHAPSFKGRLLAGYDLARAR
jgi:CelD/BcsL family acetyltransferase involved in cellulose biosynthesis